jgi:hypothetical protein
VVTPPGPSVAPLVVGLTFAVLEGGVRMPIYQVADTRPSQPAAIVLAQKPAPLPYVAPFHPPKQGRN